MRRITRVGAYLFAGIATVSSWHCTAASTTLTTPSTNKCQIALTSGQSSFGPGGGQSSVGITTSRDCPWSVAAEAAWISITGSRDGQGDAQIPFTVAANPVPSARSGAITAGPERIQLNQAAAPCTFQLSRTSDSIGAGGGRLSVGVTTLSGCGWAASSNASWIAIESGASGSASATVGLSVAANTGAARSAAVTIAGQTFTVSQNAATPSSPSPAPPAPPTPPPPAPPKDEPVDFEGKVSARAGVCPAVSFSAASKQVVADASTTYKHGQCKDLSNGDKVRVKGMEKPSGIVEADEIEFKD